MPSGLVLNTTVNIYRRTAGLQSRAGAPLNEFTTVVAEDVPARVIEKQPGRIVERAGKRDMVKTTKVYLGSNPGVNETCRITWLDDLGIERFVIVSGFVDMGGAGAVFVATGESVNG